MLWEREGRGSSPCSPWFILTLPVSAVAASPSDNQTGDERPPLAALSPVASSWAGTAPEGQESSVVSKLLQNSLDKAYGKQGNPGSPGWANSRADPLHRGLSPGWGQSPPSSARASVQAGGCSWNQARAPSHGPVGGGTGWAAGARDPHLGPGAGCSGAQPGPCADLAALQC